jgi:hypothetical protein
VLVSTFSAESKLMYLDKNSKVKRVAKIEDVPKGHHYAVLVYKSSSVFIPGDERSRTNPGHGYPERYETYDSFEHYVSLDKGEWESFVKALHFKGEKNFVFFEVAQLGSLEVSVAIK